jgi:hypothetical protein
MNVLPFLLFLAPAAPAPDVKATLQADYDLLSKAFAKADIKTFEKFLASDYRLVPPGNGKPWDRAKVLADFKRQMANMKGAKWSRHIDAVKANGSVYDVTVSGTFDGKFQMQDGKEHVFHLNSRSVDTWTLKPAAQIKKSVIQKLDATIDGKKAG